VQKIQMVLPQKRACPYRDVGFVLLKRGKLAGGTKLIAMVAFDCPSVTQSTSLKEEEAGTGVRSVNRNGALRCVSADRVKAVDAVALRQCELMTRLGHRPLRICAAHIVAPGHSFAWRTFLF
jgi:hypothetical protein